MRPAPRDGAPAILRVGGCPAVAVTRPSGHSASARAEEARARGVGKGVHGPGQEPAYPETANLTPESRAALNALDLHFHDLRREALQQVATKAGTGVQTGAQTAAGGNERPNENAVGRGSAIM
jgi:hypothetical protein